VEGARGNREVPPTLRFMNERRGRDLNPRRTFQHVRDFQSPGSGATRVVERAWDGPVRFRAVRRPPGCPKFVQNGTDQRLKPSLCCQDSVWRKPADLAKRHQ